MLPASKKGKILNALKAYKKNFIGEVFYRTPKKN